MNTAIRESVIETIVKPISPAPFKAASSGGRTLLEMTNDVLDNDHGIVDHEADRDSQRH